MKTAVVLTAAALAAGCALADAGEPQTAPASSSAIGEQAQAAPPPGGESGEITILRDRYYEPQLFAAGCAAPAPYEGAGRLRAGMVPHHLLAADMISGFFSLAGQQHAQQPYEAVLIVSPMHYPESCTSDAATAYAAWDTHLGGVEPDSGMVKSILGDSLLAAEDAPAAVEQDHGVAGLTPYVKKYLPDVPLAVCLLSNKLSGARLTAFQDLLAAQLAERDILVIASADCSHYLTPREAAKRDEQTIRAILEGERAAILGFTDSNVDSPQSVTSFLRAAQAYEAQVRLLGQSNSGDKLPHAPDNPIFADGVTSYLVFGAFVE